MRLPANLGFYESIALCAVATYGGRAFFFFLLLDRPWQLGACSIAGAPSG